MSIPQGAVGQSIGEHQGADIGEIRHLEVQAVGDGVTWSRCFRRRPFLQGYVFDRDTGICRQLGLWCRQIVDIQGGIVGPRKGAARILVEIINDISRVTDCYIRFAGGAGSAGTAYVQGAAGSNC